MADFVTITEYDDDGNVVSVTESEIHAFESVAEMRAYLDGDFDDDIDSALDEHISDYDAAHGVDDSWFRPVGE